MKKILVVVDMQKDFVNGALGTKEAVAIVPKVVDKIEEHIANGSEIIFTKDTHYDNYLETQEGINLPVKHCIVETDGWKLDKNIEPYQNKGVTISKKTFGSKDLAELIRLMKLNCEDIEVELVGLCTDICVVSNALLIKAFNPEIKIKVDASCCAGVTPESHKHALETMKMCQINVIGE